MDEKLIDFLTSLSIKEEEIELFDDAKLTNATYITSLKKFIIDISCHNLCNPQVYFIIDKIRNNKKYNFNINIIQHETLVNTPYLKEIFDKVILLKYKNIAMIQSIKNIEIEITNNKIYFLFNSSIQRDSFLTYKKEFQNIFNTLGINKIVEFDIIKKENFDLNKEFENEVQKIVNNTVEPPTANEQKTVNKFQRKTYDSSQPAEEVELSTLNQDDKNVMVTAKILSSWFKVDNKPR